MYLIVGLGNPGKEYEMTRHNIGFLVIDRLAKDFGIEVAKSHCQATIGQASIGSTKVLLAKPQTFMNLSGNSVNELLKWHKILPDNLIVIHDDLDIDIGKLKIKQKGNSAGHKGIESIISMIGTAEFIRVRIGIGREGVGGDNSGYVLSKIPANEIDAIDQAVVDAADAIMTIVKTGIRSAMNRYNPL